MSTRPSSLLDLPNEVIIRMIDYLHPCALENVCQADELLQELAAPRLEKHESLRRRYGQLIFASSGESYKEYQEGVTIDKSVSLFEVLADIVRDPWIAYYPKSLHSHSDPDMDEYAYGIPEMTGSDQRIAEDHDGFYELFKASPFLSSDDAVQWSDAVLSNYEAALAVLISVLPSLKSINFWHPCVTEYITNMTEAIAAADQSTKSLPLAALGKLSSVNIQHQFTETSTSFCLIRAFAQIPSMKSIRGSLIEEGGEHWLGPPTSNIETIDLDESSVSDSLFKFLPSIKALKRFSYEPAFGEYAIWKPGKICAVLMKHAGHSLEELRLIMGDGFDEVEDETDDDEEKDKSDPKVSPLRIGSLREFKKLQSLEIDTQLLSMAPVVDVLPESIERLKLGMPNHLEMMEKLFKGMKDTGVEKLPKLKRIEIETAVDSGVEEFMEELRGKIMADIRVTPW